MDGDSRANCKLVHGWHPTTRTNSRPHPRSLFSATEAVESDTKVDLMPTWLSFRKLSSPDKATSQPEMLRCFFLLSGKKKKKKNSKKKKKGG